MRKKKRGSTFVIVIIVMAVLFTTGTAILALTANNYKTRINESKRLQNLYEADSGLDIVKNIIIKTSQEAIKYADKEVKSKLIESTNKNKEDMSEEEINNFFESSFYNFLVSKDKYSMELLKYLILNKQIIASVNDGDIDTVALKNIPEDKNFNIDITECNYDKINGITIGVKSTFETVDEDMKNKRTVSTEFKITAPEYKAVVNTIDIYPVFDGKAITADGDMDINGKGNSESSLSISGDIWIKGIDLNDLNYNNPIFTFHKYNSGINLNNTKFNINGNIYTANTFSTNSNVVSEIEGQIYAQNVYIGKTLKEDESNKYVESGSSNNSITFKGNVIVNNDLAMNTTKSNITINNSFYGISDKTSDASDLNTALESSSIIINESQDSTLTVEGDSYILGVAYLNATDSEGKKKYQTGESVAVKGNYLAYTDVEGVLNGDENTTLRYYAPLQLLESFEGKSTADAKAKYFINYYSNQNTKYNLKNGGVNFKGKVEAAGAIVKTGDTKPQKESISDTGTQLVNNERNEYARNVFAMGDITNLEGNLTVGIYENQKVLRTVKSEIDLENRESVINIDEDKSGLILNSDESEIIIDNEDIISGLIISKGDIKIKGNFEFTGTIITLGNIIFEGDGEKVIKYDAGVVRGAISDNYDILKDVFNKNSSKGKEVKISSSSEIYNSDKFLTESSWKIER